MWIHERAHDAPADCVSASAALKSCEVALIGEILVPDAGKLFVPPLELVQRKEFLFVVAIA